MTDRILACCPLKMHIVQRRLSRSRIIVGVLSDGWQNEAARYKGARAASSKFAGIWEVAVMARNLMPVELWDASPPSCRPPESVPTDILDGWPHFPGSHSHNLPRLKLSPITCYSNCAGKYASYKRFRGKSCPQFQYPDIWSSQRSTAVRSVRATTRRTPKQACLFEAVRRALDEVGWRLYHTADSCFVSDMHDMGDGALPFGLRTAKPDGQETVTGPRGKRHLAGRLLRANPPAPLSQTHERTHTHSHTRHHGFCASRLQPRYAPCSAE